MAYLRVFGPVIILFLLLGTLPPVEGRNSSSWTVSPIPTATSVPHLPPAPTQLRTQESALPELLDAKLEYRVDQMIKSFELEGMSGALRFAKESGIELERGKVLLMLSAESGGSSSGLQSHLRSLGVDVGAGYGNFLEAAAPVAVLRELKDLPGIRFVGLPPRYYTQALPQGLVSEAVAQVGADEWHKRGFGGQGVKVAVVDLGFVDYRDLLGKELPRTVTTRCFNFFCRLDGSEDNPNAVEGSTRHGAAVAELVHDMAPYADLYLVRISSDVDMAFATNWLISQGIDVVAFSLGKVIGKYDGEDLADKIVDGARSNGILWVSAAGNEGSGHYQGIFTDRDGDGWHEFAPGVELNQVLLEPGAGLILLLNWPGWPASSDDYDLYLFIESLDGSIAPVQASGTRQDGRQPPSEVIVAFGGVPGVRHFAAIRKTSAEHNVMLKLYSIFNPLLERTPASSLTIPAGSRHALTVGATNNGHDVLEDFSAQGPASDGTIKPDLVAPDRVSTVSFGGGGFPGTSASAPLVAGAAALVLTAYPAMTPDQVQALLEERALDLGAPGKDNAFGAGRLNMGPPPEVSALATPTPSPTPQPCLAESLHPYPDNYNVFWRLVNPDPAAETTVVHFQRLETEVGFDFVLIIDGENKVVDRMSGDFPEGVWSEEARGPVVKVVLQTDESVQDWGLCIDKVASEAPPEPEEEEPERPSGREPDRATPTPTSTKVPVQAPPPPTATPVAPPLIWSANNAYLPFITKGKVAP